MPLTVVSQDQSQLQSVGSLLLQGSACLRLLSFAYNVRSNGRYVTQVLLLLLPSGHNSVQFCARLRYNFSKVWMTMLDSC